MRPAGIQADDEAALPVRRDGEALAAAPSSLMNPTSRREGESDAALLGLVSDGEQGLGTCSPESRKGSTSTVCIGGA